MIEAKRVDKSFNQTQVLFEVDFSIATGELVAITGRSGSGKSTLLYIISSLDRPTRGDVLFDQQSLLKMSPKETHHFRNETMGFIFQFHYLLPELSAIENVLLPARKTARHVELHGRACELLNQVGIGNKENRLPKELSGGEQQRVAIARALIMKPKIIFADEPTGNLDSINGNLVMDILEKITTTSNTTVIYVTHDPTFASRAHRRIHLVDGRVAPI